ncbi:MAG: class I SAM-dependent methyltransferase [Candidatus Paceibacterota bacterium]
MDFNIDKIASDYINKRFPLCSKAEKEKIIKDWKLKIKSSSYLAEDIVYRLGDLTNKKILDAGSGIGGLSISLTKRGALVTGIDIEEDLFNISLENSKHYNTQIDFVLYDGNKMPFGDSLFDYAISVSVLEHTEDPKLYISEIFRTLKKGGKLYLSFPNRFWPKETHTQLWFISYLPLSIANKLANLLGRNQMMENNVHFYSYFYINSLISNLNKTLDYEISIIKDKGKSENFVKVFIKKFMNFLGINYKLFLSHIIIVVEKK